MKAFGIMMIHYIQDYIKVKLFFIFLAHNAPTEAADIRGHTGYSSFCGSKTGQDRVQEEGGGEDDEQAEGDGDTGEDGQQGFDLPSVWRLGRQGNPV